MPIHEVARAFILNGLLSKAPHQLRNIFTGELLACTGDEVDAVLYGVSQDGYAYLQRPNSADSMNVGFLREDLEALMHEAGITLPAAADYAADERSQDLDQAHQRIAELEAEVGRLRAALEVATMPDITTSIGGETFAKLMKVIAAYPQAYPGKTHVKLDDDLRPWIKEKFGCSDREKHVFGAIVAQHFKLE